MRLLSINTTAYQDENLDILTDLTDNEITLILQPIINAERNENIWYDNDELLNALIKAYPNNIINSLENEYLEL